MMGLNRYSVLEVVEGLRDYWSRTNKKEFLDDLFSGWDEEDPSEYYHNKWIVFRASPIQFWCSCDSEKQNILHEKIREAVSRSTGQIPNTPHDYDEFSHSPF